LRPPVSWVRFAGFGALDTGLVAAGVGRSICRKIVVG
jgi:hypothetical protein